jgi:DNA-binding NtrC family response regulator
MDNKEALKIIRMIADGEDPYKDEGRAKYLPEHNPKTLKALCTAIASMFPIDDEKNETFSHQPLMLSNFKKGLVEDFIKKLEKDAIIEAFTKTLFKQSDAAEYLGITYPDLLSKIQEHDIENHIKNMERDVIIEALNKAHFNKDDATEILGISYSDLSSKIQEHDINKEFLLLSIEADYQNQLNRISLHRYLEIVEENAILKALERTRLKQDAAELLGISFRTIRYRINKLSTTSITSSVNSDYFKHSWKTISLDDFIKVIDKKVIEIALQETKNRKMEAAERLGISFRTLRYRIKQHGIE